MTGISSGGGRAGHPDLIGRAAPVLKVTAVGRDPLRAAAHGGDSDRVSSGSLKGDERNAQAGSIRGLLHVTADQLPDCQPTLRFYTSHFQPCPSPVKLSPVHEPALAESETSVETDAGPAAQICASSL